MKFGFECCNWRLAEVPPNLSNQIKVNLANHDNINGFSRSNFGN